MQPLRLTAIDSYYVEDVAHLKYLHKTDKTILEGQMDKREGKKNAKNLTGQLSKIGTSGRGE